LVWVVVPLSMITAVPSYVTLIAVLATKPVPVSLTAVSTGPVAGVMVRAPAEIMVIVVTASIFVVFVSGLEYRLVAKT